MRQRHPRVWNRPGLLVLLVLMLVAAACGKDKDNSKVAADQSTTTTAAAESTTSTEAATSSTVTTIAAGVASTTATTAKKTTGPTTAITAAPTTTVPPLSGDIRVLAAASLTDSFNEMGKAFEAAHPGIHVTFNYDSSSTLATQANQGAPADLFASADDANMKKATDGGSALDPKTFTKNRMAIIVGKGNPKNIASVKDFERSGLFWVRCDDPVPCGAYANQILANAKVDVANHPPKSKEQNVKGVVTKVTGGSADAGIVYVTDGKAASSSSETIDIPDDINVIANYPIAKLKQSKHADVAQAFIDFVLSEQGQNILAKYGFLPL